MLESCAPHANVIGELFVVFLNALLAFRHHLESVRKGRSILGCAWLVIIQYARMYLGATLLDKQGLRKAAENLTVEILPLVLTTLT